MLNKVFADEISGDVGMSFALVGGPILFTGLMTRFHLRDWRRWFSLSEMVDRDLSQYVFGDIGGLFPGGRRTDLFV